MGRLIPAGTGLDLYAGIQIMPDLPPHIEEEVPEEIPVEEALDTDRFAEMLRAAAAAASGAAGNEPSRTA